MGFDTTGSIPDPAIMFKKKKMQLIEVSKDLHDELIRIKYKNRYESISDVIIEMIRILKQYQNDEKCLEKNVNLN